MIKAFVRFEWIKGSQFFAAEEIANRVNACLVIAEMFVGEFFLAATFSYIPLRDWKPALQYTNDKSVSSIEEEEEEIQYETEKDQLLEETASTGSFRTSLDHDKELEE